MAIYFFDSSAIVKYYHDEPGSIWTRQIVDARGISNGDRSNVVYVSAASIAEVPAAFAILERNKRTSLRLRDSLYRAFIDALENELRILQVTVDLFYNAARLTQQHPLKGYDAVQLATALDFQTRLKEQDLSLIFVSGDANLVEAAQAEGLTTENPFDHSDLDSNS